MLFLKTFTCQFQKNWHTIKKFYISEETAEVDWIEINRDKKQAVKEKAKARELKKSHWWKNLISSGTCHYCKQKFSPKELTMDHIVPLSRGGRSIRGNVVPSCKSCNNDKKFLTPAEIILKEMESEKSASG